MKYYLHDSNSFNDDKITELFINFGYEGIGLFYTILEKFAYQEKPIKTEVLKSQLKVGKKLEKCWIFMESLELISSNNGETFNKQLLNFSQKYQIKKEKNKEKIKQWRENQTIKENVTSYEPNCNSPKLNKSKLNKSKLNKDVAMPLSDYQKCIEFWLKEFKIGWTFTGQHGKSLKSIIKKIEESIKKAGNEIDEKIIFETFKLICLKLPNWYKEKDLPIIDSKFNEIIAEIKNNPNGTAKQSRSSANAAAMERVRQNLENINLRESQ